MGFFIQPYCSGNTDLCLEAVIEHLVGRQGQPKGAQVHAVHMIEYKGCPPLPRPHLRVGSGDERILYGDPCLPKGLTGLSKISISLYFCTYCYHI